MLKEDIVERIAEQVLEEYADRALMLQVEAEAVKTAVHEQLEAESTLLEDHLASNQEDNAYSMTQESALSAEAEKEGSTIV